MKVRGIDPGPDWLAWCDLDISTGRPVFLAMGETQASDALSLLDGTTIVVIEIAIALLIGVMDGIAAAKSKAEKTLRTNRVADRIVHAAPARGVRVIEVDQSSARHGLGFQSHLSGKGEGKMTADKQVEAIVRELVVGFPAARRDSNPDKRDAALYALSGWQVLKIESKEA